MERKLLHLHQALRLSDQHFSAWIASLEASFINFVIFGAQSRPPSSRSPKYIVVITPLSIPYRTSYLLNRFLICQFLRHPEPIQSLQDLPLPSRYLSFQRDLQHAGLNRILVILCHWIQLLQFIIQPLRKNENLKQASESSSVHCANLLLQPELYLETFT